MSCRHLAVSFVIALGMAASAQGQSVLADKIQAGDRKAALALIAGGANVNQTQPDGSTPLQWAVYRVDRELVTALLRRGAKADVVNKYGASPLAEAARVANVEIAGMLLEAGAAPDASNEDGQTPLMLAARTGVVAVAKLLVQHGTKDQLAVHVHPSDAALLAAGRDGNEAWRWVADDAVQLGGVILRSPEGSLDARLEIQLAALREALLKTRAQRAEDVAS